jgi:hypothetical protein
MWAMCPWLTDRSHHKHAEEEAEEQDEGDRRVDADPSDRVHVVFDELQHPFDQGFGGASSDLSGPWL